MLIAVYSALQSFLLDFEAMNLEASLWSWGQGGRGGNRRAGLKHWKLIAVKLQRLIITGKALYCLL